jgi:hypothetical protein
MKIVFKNSVSARYKMKWASITWMYTLWEIAEFVSAKADGTYTYYCNSEG